MKKFISLISLMAIILSLFSLNVNAADEYNISITRSRTDTVKITCDKDTAEAGETVEVTATAADGYYISDIYAIKSSGNSFREITAEHKDGNIYTFTMPDTDVTIYGKATKERAEKKVEINFSAEYGYGEVFLNQYTAYKGDTLEFRVVPKKGYTAECLLINEIEIPLDEVKDGIYTYYYTVDAEYVDVDVEFRRADNTLYDIYVDTRIGGTGFADKKQASPGETVTVTVSPNKGKDFVTVTCNNKEIKGENNVYTFTMPERKAVIDIICKEGDYVAKNPVWENVGGWKLKGVNGKYIIGWQKIDNVWYFLKNNEYMAIDWNKIEGKWYYFSTSGAMKTGWVKDNDNWYFMDSTGAMKTGWVSSNGKWYYLYEDGKMAKDTYIDNRYKLDADGAWIE